MRLICFLLFPALVWSNEGLEENWEWFPCTNCMIVFLDYFDVPYSEYENLTRGPDVSKYLENKFSSYSREEFIDWAENREKKFHPVIKTHGETVTISFHYPQDGRFIIYDADAWYDQEGRLTNFVFGSTTDYTEGPWIHLNIEDPYPRPRP